MGERENHIGIVDHGLSAELLIEAVNLVYLCLQSPKFFRFAEYDYLSNNCEHFVCFIVTGGNVRESFQSQTLGRLLIEDLNESKGQFTIAYAALVIHTSGRISNSFENQPYGNDICAMM